jgi:hypothetical protein
MKFSKGGIFARGHGLIIAFSLLFIGPDSYSILHHKYLSTAQNVSLRDDKLFSMIKYATINHIV